MVAVYFRNPTKHTGTNVPLLKCVKRTLLLIQKALDAAVVVVYLQPI